MIRRLTLCVLAACVLGGWLIGPPIPAPSYTGPGDYASFTAWWGLRAYDAAKAAAEVDAIDLRRASDNDTCTAKVATDGSLDLTVGTPCNGNTQTVTAWIGASSALATKLYDQTAGSACAASSCDLVQATAAAQPQLVLNCNGTLPCLRATCGTCASGKILSSANNYTPAGTSISLSVVANRASGSQTAFLVMSNNTGISNRNRISMNATAWLVGGLVGSLAATTSNAVWHAAQGVIVNNPSISTLNIDGTETTATTVTISTVADLPGTQLAQAFSTITTEIAEAGFQGNAAWTASARTNLCHNQRLYWSTGGSC